MSGCPLAEIGICTLQTGSVRWRG